MGSLLELKIDVILYDTAILLALGAGDKDLFSNIHGFLVIVCILCISSAEAER